MKKRIGVALALGMLLAALLCNVAFAGTEEKPCLACSDTTQGYRYKYIPITKQHLRTCNNCFNDNDILGCYGGTATCTHGKICVDCGGEYDSTRAPHTPGAAATCTTPQVCTVCNEILATATGHTPGAPATCTTPQVCTVCNEILAIATGHTPGAPATCTTPQVCTVCNEILAPAIGHTPGAPATCTTPQSCTVCNAVITPAGHTPGVGATCTTPQVCTVCNEILAPVTGHTPGAAATCTTPQVCTVCNEILAPATGHTPGAPATCTTPQTCTVCNEILAAATGHTPGAAATCTTPQICTVCNAVLAPATGHTYISSVSNPTCVQQGYTTHRCAACGDSYTDEFTSALGHYYVMWTNNGNDTHSAKCRWCDDEKTADCATDYQFLIATEAESTLWNVCPICGRMNDLLLPMYETPAITAIDKNAIPHGKPIVRGLASPFDGAYYALTAVYGYAGKVEPLNGRISITVPVALAEEMPFKVVHVGAAETTEARAVGTEIPFTWENGMLTFETDIGGLFLLVPVD